MKVLELSFVTTGGKTAKLAIDHPEEPVDIEKVSEAMDEMIAAGVFFDSDGHIYEQKKSARLIERSVTDYPLN